MTQLLSEKEVLQFLHDVENGAIILTPLREPQDIYAGNVEYAASNSWRITVFNDANEWDYIDSVSADDGRSLNYDHIDKIDSLRNYEVTDEVAWKCYRIPGYMGFRCTRCSAPFNYRRDKIFLCQACLER